MGQRWKTGGRNSLVRGVRIAMVTSLGFLLVAGRGSQRAVAQRPSVYIDDFSRPTRGWRFGSAVLGDGPNGLTLDSKQTDVTLSGTAMNPRNLQMFSAKLRWSGGLEKTLLTVGWGKTREWDDIDACAARLTVDAHGQVVLVVAGKVLGRTQLASGSSELTFRQDSEQVVVSGEKGDTVFVLPAGTVLHDGYLMLHVEGSPVVKEVHPVRIERVEVNSKGNAAPLTEVQRTQGNQDWARHREELNWAVLDSFKAKVTKETKAGRWGFGTDLTIRPALVNPGEPVTIAFHNTGKAPAGTAQVEPDYLGASPRQPQALNIVWTADGHGGQTGHAELRPQIPGNWRVTWSVGGEKLTRVLAVAGPGYIVCRVLFTNYKGPWTPGHDRTAYDTVHELGLPSDSWTGDEWASPFGRTPDALLARFGFFSRNHHLYGDHIMPLANANWMMPGDPDANLWRYDDDVQRIGIRQISQLWNVLSLGPMDVMGGYTFGNTTAKIARGEGVKMIDSLVQWQNWRDGGSENSWLINDWGAPIVPYFVADDDFRKVAPGKSIVAFTQATTSDVRVYDIMTTEGQPQLNARRAHNADMGESSNIDRFETAVDLWLAEAPHQKEPLFVSVGLENFLDSPDWDEANKRGVTYLRAKAREGRKLVFVSAEDVAGYFERHYQQQPENWIVWPDVYAGQPGQFKPAELPERIELSNSRFHTVHEAGDALPKFFWDYTHPWSQPIWDDQKSIRTKFGLVDPDLLTAENSVPAMVPLDGVKADVKERIISQGIEVTITVDSIRALPYLPVAVWHIPLASAVVASASERARYVGVVDGSTGNAHAVVVCDRVPAGKSVWIVRLKGTSKEPVSTELKIGETVRGRLFLRDGTPQVYLWLVGGNSGVLKIAVPIGSKVSTHDNIGHVEESHGGELSIVMDGSWQHGSPSVTGLTVKQLEKSAHFEARK